ncbi:hypothetical protein PG990_012240 [Apiospora arundinis]
MSTPTPTPFTIKWVGEKQERATQIRDSEWVKRKPRLRELYIKLTAPELKSAMEAEGFKAT